MHLRTFEGGLKEGIGEGQGGDEEGEGAVELHNCGMDKARRVIFAVECTCEYGDDGGNGVGV
jgi:hypothetical protein